MRTLDKYQISKIKSQRVSHLERSARLAEDGESRRERSRYSNTETSRDARSGELGFGLIGLLITVAIIAFLIFAGKNFMSRDKNQVQSGQEAVKQAENAAKSEQEHGIDIQNELNSSSDVNYHGVLDDIR